MTRPRSFWDHAALAFARLWPAGLSPWAPGTAGALVATVLAPYVFLPLSLPGRCLLLAAVFVAGGLAASRAERVLGRQDPGEVVVDELLGQWVVYLPFAALSWPYVLLGFVLFRVFDIAKPPPVRQAEQWLPSGWGVMIDDVAAGACAAAVMLLVRVFL